jgi:septum formation topological specificity factor MinE
VAAELAQLAADRLQLLEMARRARTRAMPHAAESLMRAVLDVAERGS